MITDIKAVNIYDWVEEDGLKYWKCTGHKIMFLRDGEWVEVRVEHENRKPDDDKEGV
jgi:hypothetical protein